MKWIVFSVVSLSSPWNYEGYALKFSEATMEHFSSSKYTCDSDNHWVECLDTPSKAHDHGGINDKLINGEHKRDQSADSHMFYRCRRGRNFPVLGRYVVL